MSSNVRINIENFRAIRKAEIKIDGITLVAGENGSGKSTLSKLLYFLYKTVSNYESIVDNQLIGKLNSILLYLEILIQESKLPQRDRREIREDIRKIRRNTSYQDWVSLIDKIEHLFTEYNVLDVDNPRWNRIIKITEDVLGDNISEEKGFEKIQEFITNQFKEADGKKQSRPISLFINELSKEFSGSKLPSRFEVLEFNDIIVSLSKSNLSIPYTIRNCVYIDTPMSITVEDKNTHWDDLNILLSDSNKNNISEDIEDISKIINGDVYIEDDLFDDDFKYKRIDGKTFDLLDVATGIKAFSILQLLLKGGHLTKNTLLIIDEPESNLHPQWIVEYARIIVKLNKHLGVKFVLASHNPDMVSAIRYISEKEGILDNVNFYLAEREKETFTYNYKDLGKEIDPIFGSFNIALDRINQYGGGDEV
ncbi:AAA family ATPase [Bergeyella porcorum]|uniref:AAA family ATPase n=1 Tax=Bergeyella porcorum TaxID=1735111 RepID=UPI0035EF6D98